MADSARGESFGEVDRAQMREFAERKSRAEEQRQRILAEIQERAPAVMGAFGTQRFDGGQQPNSLSNLAERDANPLRSDAAPLPKPTVEPRLPTVGNPLRESRMAPSAAPTAMPPLPSPLAGGAAPPPGGLAEIERAFSSLPPPPAVAIEPLAARATGPAAPESMGSALPPLPEEAIASVASAPSQPAVPAEESPYEVVEVFYGTDRQSAEAAPSDWRHLLRGFLPTACVGLMAICLTLVAFGRRSRLLGFLAAGGLAASLGLGYEATAETLALLRGVGKQGPRYTTARSPGGHVDLGRCEITIPKTHEVGELEAPSVLRLEVSENAARHLILQKTERLADARFYELLRQRVEYSPHRELFVFVHGFNVSFEDAARRTAQIHYDLKFDGAPIFFSWPAHDKFILTYPADETNVAWSVPHLKQFLLSIVKESQAKSINLVAHSMGNRALAAALREIELEMHDQAKLFNQVILAAPDIDADDFRNNIAPAMLRTTQRLTLYASSHDEALLASQFVHRGARAGDAGEGLIVVPGIDTIDVTAIDSSLWGHSYYGSSNPVLHDLRMLLSRAIPPRDRTWLSPAERDGLTYWIFQPTRTAGAEGAQTR